MPQKTARSGGRYRFVVLKMLPFPGTLGVDRLDAAVLTSVFNEHSFAPLDAENQGKTIDFSLGAIKRRFTHLGTCGA